MICLRTLTKTRCMQYISSISATLFLSCIGMYTIWSSPTLPKLTSEESPIGITLTPSEASLVASSFQLGYLPGGILSGLIVSSFGPRASLLLATIPLFCPWVAIFFAKSALTLCIARFVAGFGCSIAATAVPIYSGEITDKDIRGKLGTTCSMQIFIGCLLVLSVGPFVSYSTLAMICGIFPLIFGCIIWFMPESPYYLVKTKQTSKARSIIFTLSSLNIGQQVVEDKLGEVTNTVEQDMKNRSSFWELFTNPIYRKPLLILTGIKLTQQFCGLAAIDVYMQTIIKSSKSSVTPELASIIYGTIPLLPAMIAATFVDYVGRRPLLITSALGSAVALSIEGIYFYHYYNEEQSSWMPIAGLILYSIMNPLGLSTLFYVLLGEMFPTNIKSRAVSLFTVQYGFLGSIVILSFEPMSKLWGMSAPFFAFAIVAVLGAIFIFVALPETKRKTFIEIQSNLQSREFFSSRA